jgi:hypothetical protein
MKLSLSVIDYIVNNNNYELKQSIQRDIWVCSFQSKYWFIKAATKEEAQLKLSKSQHFKDHFFNGENYAFHDKVCVNSSLNCSLCKDRGIKGRCYGHNDVTDEEWLVKAKQCYLCILNDVPVIE